MGYFLKLIEDMKAKARPEEEIEAEILGLNSIAVDIQFLWDLKNAYYKSEKPLGLAIWEKDMAEMERKFIVLNHTGNGEV